SSAVLSPLSLHDALPIFRATLEEVAEADLVLHVVDAGSADRERQMAAVRRVLEDVGATSVPIVDVYNKIDTITAHEQRRLRDRRSEEHTSELQSRENLVC